MPNGVALSFCDICAL